MKKGIMKKGPDAVAQATDPNPVDLSTLVLGDVTKLTKDGNPFQSCFDAWFWHSWYKEPCSL